MSIDSNKKELEKFETTPDTYLILKVGKDNKQHLKCVGTWGVICSRVKHFFNMKNTPFIQDVFQFIADNGLINREGTKKLLNNYYTAHSQQPLFPTLKEKIQYASEKLLSRFLKREELSSEAQEVSKLPLTESYSQKMVAIIRKQLFEKARKDASTNSHKALAKPAPAQTPVAQLDPIEPAEVPSEVDPSIKAYEEQRRLLQEFISQIGDQKCPLSAAAVTLNKITDKSIYDSYLEEILSKLSDRNDYDCNLTNKIFNAILTAEMDPFMENFVSGSSPAVLTKIHQVFNEGKKKKLAQALFDVCSLEFLNKIDKPYKTMLIEFMVNPLLTNPPEANEAFASKALTIFENIQLPEVTESERIRIEQAQKQAQEIASKL